MPAERFDVAVVGAGVMGSATAYALARTGRSVVVLERYELGHKRGSSHGTSRIFRLSYPETRYVEMAIEARSLWRDVEQASGRELLVTTGGIDVGEAGEDIAAALEACGIGFELLEGSAAHGRFSTVQVLNNETILLQPDAGVVAADAAVATFQHGTEGAGGEIRTLTQVLALEPGEDLVEVVTDHGSVTASVVVVTAGAWVADLLAPLGFDVPVQPTRETVAYFEIEGALPALVEWGDPLMYALPTLHGDLKVAEHIAGPPADPDSTGGVNEISLETLREWVASRFVGAAPKEHHSETCLYTNTPDESFILQRIGRLVIGSPCSGHGFKFAPLIGERLAALAGEVL